MKIIRTSVITGNINSMEIPVNPEDLITWEKGAANIQDIMPYLSDEHREFILSGITPAEWDKAFAEADEL